MAHNRGRLDDALARCLDDRLSRKRLRKLTINPEGAVDFSSNTYLGLSSQPAVRRAFFARLQSAPPGLLLGSGGSRLLDGNSTFATDVEKAVTAFHRSPSGLLFTSAMDANVGLFGCVPQPGDTILYDELIHASIHDGMRLGRASTLPFAHSRVWENSPEPAAAGKLKPLETVIKSLLQGPDGSLFASGERNVFIAVEGVYSMDGDVPPLLDIVECVERCLPQGNGYVIVDEAHSNGVFGNRGRGLVCELGLEERVWARVMGFGKAMGCSGGIVLCSPTTRDYLINYARTFIYTTALSFLSLASIETTYNFVATGQAEPLLQNLRFLIRETHKLFVALCSKHKAPTDILRVNTEPSKSPILPVFTHHPWSLAKHCQDKGFMVRPIMAPTVPAGSERIRVTLHASNTMAEVEGLVAAVEAWLVTTTRERTSQSPTGRLADRGHGSRQHSATPPGAGHSSPKL